jgi:hypothetical protein
MESIRQQFRIVRNLTAACGLGCLLAGCSVVGPTAISNGRLAYNKAITETNNQQMLLTIVQNRYVETGSLLAVSSITANVRVITSTGIQLGFGDADDYAGNLVPLSAGAVYEENPTISYTPVAGTKYVSQLMTPVPVDVLAQFAGTLACPTYIYTTLVSSVNGIKNPDFLYSTAEPDPRFNRLVEIITALTREQRLSWARDPEQKDGFSIIIDRTATTGTDEVSELLQLLGLPQPEEVETRLVVPFFLAIDGRDSGGIGITTRSVYDLLEILAAAVKVPEADQQNDVATRYPEPGPAGKDLRIRYAETRPEHAYVEVKYRDGWFYIDERDQATKQFFRLLGILWSTTIAESTARAGGAPVLTVPVSR